MSLRFLTAKLLRAMVTLWLAVTFVFIVLRVSGCTSMVGADGLLMS